MRRAAFEWMLDGITGKAAWEACREHNTELGYQLSNPLQHYKALHFVHRAYLWFPITVRKRGDYFLDKNNGHVSCKWSRSVCLQGVTWILSIAIISLTYELNAHAHLNMYTYIIYQISPTIFGTYCTFLRQTSCHSLKTIWELQLLLLVTKQLRWDPLFGSICL